ncbi:unnamed protein product [Phytophthora lilii]|uniref:Unnamed protein product n=1 Tax=Phytophthora lilii TaxID=2077276 RepID=A0A9W6TV30_9STRA|nr:unnamed protein product [Phytophthora lilii]
MRLSIFGNARLPEAVMALPHVIHNIAVMAMTPVEVLLEAARTSQLKWLGELVDTFDRRLLFASAVHAAATNNVKVVTVLLERIITSHLSDDTENDTKYVRWSQEQIAQLVTADNDSSCIIKILEETYVNSNERHIVCLVMEQAVATGNLSLVKWISEFMCKHSLHDELSDDIMSAAICWGHIDVAEYFLSVGQFEWYSVIMILMKRSGEVNSTSWTEFLRLAVLCLIVSSKRALFGKDSVRRFLYEQNRVSTPSLNRAFEYSRSLVAVKLLYQSGKILPDSVIVLFRNAANGGDVGGLPFPPIQRL